MSVAFHELALFYMYRGFAAAQQLRGLAVAGKSKGFGLHRLNYLLQGAARGCNIPGACG